MAPYQFFLLFVAVLFIGVAAVTLNQAANTEEATPSHVVVESVPDVPVTPAASDTVRL
ncbi:MAG: hypothetical protein ABJF88_13425 [Rhodothermales bacterium]